MKKTLKIAILLWLTMAVMLMFASCDELLIKLQFGNAETTPEASTPNSPEGGTPSEDVTLPEDVTPPEGISCTHSETEYIPAVERTCTQDGITEGLRCLLCGESLREQAIIPAGHTMVVDERVEPTCTQTGLTEGMHCSVCGEVFVEQTELSVIGHNYTYVVTLPTATEDGCTTYTCMCGDIYDEVIKPVDFEVTKDNRAMVGYTGEEGETLVIPAVFQHDGTWYRVTLIGHSAFANCNGLKSVTIPDSVMKLEEDSFRACTMLSEVNLGTSVKYIIGAFKVCSSLTSITIPDSVKTIGPFAFSGCSSLKSITIPDSVENIGPYAFYYCSSLTSITIPFVGSYKGEVDGYFGFLFGESRDSIDVYVPASLKTVVITGGTNIGYAAFSYCSNITSITLPDSVETIGSSAFYGCSNLASINIPDSVTTIGSGAFYGCSNLASVNIPNQVTAIGRAAFYNCSGLTNIKVPDSVMTIGVEAFYGCDNLESITLPFVGENKDGTGDTRFGHIFGKMSSGFQYNPPPESLKTVIITGGTSIGESAFYGCSGLTSIKIPDSIMTIGDWAFYKCNGLTSVTIPDSVITIGYEAFGQCSNLTSVSIPASVTQIGSQAFVFCIALRGLTFAGTVEQWNAISFGGTLVQTMLPFVVTCADGTVNLQ